MDGLALALKPNEDTTRLAPALTDAPARFYMLDGASFQANSG
jgi:hypothetical protein